MNNETLEKFCNKILAEIETLKITSIEGKRGGDYRIGLTHAQQTIRGTLLDMRKGNNLKSTKCNNSHV